VGICHQGLRSLTEEPPRAQRKVERLTRNPEKLANAGWNDTLGRKRFFRTHRPPYPFRRGLVTTWQETKNSYMTMDLNKKVGNNVNGATFQRGGGFASGKKVAPLMSLPTFFYKLTKLNKQN